MTDRTCMDCGKPIPLVPSVNDTTHGARAIGYTVDPDAYAALQQEHRVRCDACVAIVVETAAKRRRERAEERMLRGRPALVEARDVVETVQRAIV